MSNSNYRNFTIIIAFIILLTIISGYAIFSSRYKDEVEPLLTSAKDINK